MYKVSVLDDGEERSLLADSVMLTGSSLLVSNRDTVHLFKPTQLVELMVVEDTPDDCVGIVLETSRSVYKGKDPER